MTSISHQHILVGIETDPTRYYGEHATRPALLDRAASEQVLAHVAADLTALFPDIDRCTVSMAGALFDQTQALRPQLPVFRALETLQQSSNPGSDFRPRLLSIGADRGRMPLEDLQPLDDIPLGLLQVLPLLVSGPAELVGDLASDMEHRFLEQGQLSAHSAKGLESHFRVSVNHARFMTITDLNAMLRMQLEHFGYLPLWQLLDAAISGAAETLDVSAAGGPRFVWRGGRVHTYFETFDWWARHGSGAGETAADQNLQAAYAGWTREYRRYLAMLTAHGITPIRHLAGLEESELGDSFLLEESTLTPGEHAAPVTEHSVDELGVVAVTVAHGRRQMNLYPLLANGLDAMHDFIRDSGYAGDVAYPGRICHSAEDRRLIAARLPPQ